LLLHPGLPSAATAPEVAVVGSGPSGLAAAFRLQQAGFAVRMFEASNQVGGKMRTSVHDGFVIDEGATIMPSTYDAAFALAADAGLADELIPGGSIFGFARDGRIHYVDPDHPLRTLARFRYLTPRSRLKMARITADLMRQRKLLSFEDLSNAADGDTGETAAEYALRAGNQEILDYIVDMQVRAHSGLSAADVSSVDFRFQFVKFIGAKFFAFRDGMGSYANAMASRWAVELGSRVQNVALVDDEVELTWTDADGEAQSARFAGCVLAVQAFATAGIYQNLTAQRRAFLRRVEYTKIVCAAVGLSRKPDTPAAVISVPRSVHPGLIDIGVEHHKAPGRAPGGKGLLNLYASSAWSQELMSLDDQDVVDRLLDAAERVLPGVSRDVEFASVNRWDPMVIRGVPGQWRQLRDFNEARRREDTLVQLAGDYFACGNINAATVAGERAARELVAALPRTSRLDTIRPTRLAMRHV